MVALHRDPYQEYWPDPGTCVVCGMDIDDVNDGDLCCSNHEGECPNYPCHPNCCPDCNQEGGAE